MFIKQQNWTKLFHVTTIGIDEVKDFHTVKKDGISMDGKPLMTHLRMLKGFLLYFKRMCREHDTLLTANDVMNITSAQFYSYLGSDDYFMDLTACDKESSTKQVDAVNTSIVGIVNDPESYKTQDFHGSSHFDQDLTEEDIVNVDIDIDTGHADVINDGAYISGRSTGEDILMKLQPSKCVVDNDLQETTPIDAPASDYSRNPNGEYDPDYEEIDILNVLIDEIDPIRHLDKNNGGGKPPYKLSERNKSKQECKERKIADSFGSF